MAKIIVDEEACIGCGACVSQCPEAFKMDEKTHKSVAKPGAEKVACVDDGIDVCPVDAISKK